MEPEKGVSQRIEEWMRKHLAKHHGPRSVGPPELKEGLGTLAEHGNAHHAPNFAEDSAVVKLLGAQTVAGIKTFTSIPVLPAADPTADNEAVRKLYVDDHAVANNKIFDAKGDLIGGTGANAGARLAVSTNGKILVPDSGEATGLKWKWDETGIAFIIDGGGDVIETGVAGGLEVAFDCFVTGWTILAVDGNSGSIVVDVWADSYANHPPTVADTIAGAEKPTINASTKGQDLALGTWTCALTKGQILFFNVDSIATLERVALSLRVDKYRAA